MSIFQMYFRTHIKNAFRTTSILLFFNQFQKWIATKTSAFPIHAYISIFIFLLSAVWFHSFIIYDLQENFIIILHFHINFLKKKEEVNIERTDIYSSQNWMEIENAFSQCKKFQSKSTEFDVKVEITEQLLVRFEFYKEKYKHYIISKHMPPIPVKVYFQFLQAHFLWIQHPCHGFHLYGLWSVIHATLI